MSTPIYVHKAHNTEGTIVHVTDDIGVETFDPQKEAKDIFAVLYDNLPATTIAWLRNELVDHVGNIEKV